MTVQQKERDRVVAGPSERHGGGQRTRRQPWNLWRSLTRSRFFAVLIMLVALVLWLSLTQDAFLTTSNINTLLTSVSILFVVSIGLTFVVLSHGFDLSVGSTLALTGIMLSVLVTEAGVPVGVAVACTLAAGAALGALVNGTLIGRFGLPFLVVTLGTLILFRGVGNLWSGGNTTQVSSSFLEAVAFDHFVGLPVPAWIMLGSLLVALYLLRETYFGRDVYAVGGNADAARLAGTNVTRTLIAVYGIAGLMAALGGVLQVARVGAASPPVGEAILFDAAAAVLLGGTTFAGGVGGVGGTAIAVLFLGTLQNGLSLMGVSSFWQQIVSGAILVVVVFVDKVQRDGWASLGSRSYTPRH